MWTEQSTRGQVALPYDVINPEHFQQVVLHACGRLALQQSQRARLPIADEERTGPIGWHFVQSRLLGAVGLLDGHHLVDDRRAAEP